MKNFATGSSVGENAASGQNPKVSPGDTVYYADPLKDEFSGVGARRSVTVDAAYPYIRRSWLWRAARFFVYRIAVTPFAFLYSHFKLHLRIEGAEKLKSYRKSGYFLYGNHTQIPGDGFMPNVLTFPQDIYMIVNPDNVALPGTRNLMMMLGTLPTPTELSGFLPFGEALQTRLQQGCAVMVYPEAHIWPYYTGIRPFGSVSFRYPVKFGVPSFSFTVTYRKTHRGKPAVVAYVDGPFYPQGETEKKRRQNLRDQVYQAMCSRASCPENQAFITYLPQEERKSSEPVFNKPCGANVLTQTPPKEEKAL